MRRKSSNSVKIFYPRFSLKEALRKLRRRILRLAGETPLRLVVLFGSYAARRYTAASDLDLLVVVDCSQAEKDQVYLKIHRQLKLPNLQLHLYTQAEYLKMKREGSAFLRAVEGGIKIWEFQG